MRPQPASIPVAPAPAEAPRAPARERRYGVRVDALALLLPQGEACEIAAGLPGCRLPNTPAWLAGVMNHRGTMVPVIDFSLLLGNSARAPRARSWALVIGQREHSIGLLASSLPQGLDLLPDERLAQPPALHPRLDPYVAGAFQIEDELWYDWDMDGFFTLLGDSVADSSDPSEAPCAT